MICNKEHMITMKLCTKQNVTMMSTVHKHKVVPITKLSETVFKPKPLVGYNKDMGAVNTSSVLMISFSKQLSGIRHFISARHHCIECIQLI